MEINQLIDKIKEFRDKYGALKCAECFERDILEKNDAELSYAFLLCLQNSNYISDVTKHQQIVIESNKPDCIYQFAKNIKGTDIEKLTDAIIKTKNSEYICEFAKYVSGANIQKLLNAIIELGDPLYILTFATDIPEADVNALANALVNTGDAYIAGAFLISVGELSNDVREKLIDIVINGGEFHDIFGVAINAIISNKEKQKLTNAVIKRAVAREIYAFARYVEKSDINALTDAVIKTGDAYFICEFALKINGANLDKLANELIIIGNPIYIMGLLIAHPRYEERYGISAEGLLEKIIKTDDEDFILQAQTYFKKNLFFAHSSEETRKIVKEYSDRLTYVLNNGNQILSEEENIKKLIREN